MSEKIEFIPAPKLLPYQEEFLKLMLEQKSKAESLCIIPKEILDGVSLNPNEDYFPA